MKQWKVSATIVMIVALIVAQYILAFFVVYSPVPIIQWIGWGVWAISVIFGFAPIYILGRKGGVPKGKSYVETTRLVDTGLYSIVRHPQYLAGILFNLAMMLISPHWSVIGLGMVSAVLIYFDIRAADQEGIEKFGDAYRDYMQRVPRANFLLGIARLIKTKLAGTR
ncbi:MAG: isoprenylcysteine carboxylmethyltransferase family protein [Anaerolineae bacterium]|nr:isoprenylcysteine carboxylmethyltransferase family protein [Anaerolineae bacterium]